MICFFVFCFLFFNSILSCLRLQKSIRSTLDICMIASAATVTNVVADTDDNQQNNSVEDLKALAEKSTYRIAIVTDLDQESKDKSGAQVFWKSYLRYATLQR